MGGAGKVAEVLARVGEAMKGTLRDVDYQPLGSSPDMPRWRNTAQWARNSMVKEGLLKALLDEFTVVNKFLIADLRQLGLWNQDMLDQIKYNDGSIQAIAAIPDHLRHKYKEVFELDPLWLIEMSALRGKWIDQSQSHNVFMKGVSGKMLHDIYTTAWKKGLKATYYLRTLGASQIEKSTLDAKKFGFTQKREYGFNQEVAVTASISSEQITAETMMGETTIVTQTVTKTNISSITINPATSADARNADARSTDARSIDSSGERASCSLKKDPAQSDEDCDVCQ